MDFNEIQAFWMSLFMYSGAKQILFKQWQEELCPKVQLAKGLNK